MARQPLTAGHVLIYVLVEWLALATSAVLLAVLWSSGDLGPVQTGVLLALVILGVYCQFFGQSIAANVAGRGLLALLAVYLVLRWKFAE